MHVFTEQNKNGTKFPRGFELTAQILSEQTILDLACFNGWNKPQVDQLSYYFWVKISIGWERKDFKQYLPVLFLRCAKMKLSCNSYSTAKVEVIFQKLSEQDLQILTTHKCSQHFRRIQPKSLSFFKVYLLISVLNLEAHLKTRSQWQALSVSENMTLVNMTWGQRESKLA